MSGKQVGAEWLADYFVNYLFENYHGTRHVRRVASWVGLIVLAVDRIGEERRIGYKRQLKFTFRGRTFKVKYNHQIEGSSRGGIQIIEVLSGRGSPEGGTVTSITSLSEAERFYKDAGEIIRQFVRQKPQTDSG